MKISRVLCLAAAMAACSGAAFAHHAFNMYDAAVFRSVDGVVTSYTWTNPHTMVEFTVADAGGANQTWTAECSPINMLGRKGWSSRSLAVGDKVKFVVHPNKQNEKYGLLVSATKADGVVLKDKD